MRRATVVLLACLAAACPHRGVSPTGGPAGGGGFDLDREQKALVLPPAEGTPAALERVMQAAAAGDARAAWAEVHYLIDLFDWARFAPDSKARAVLIERLHVTEGGNVTDAALDAILVEVDRILAADRLDVNATAARAVLGYDRQPPRTRSDALSKMTALKGVARGSGPLAANATLRLAAFCRRAFTDAIAAPFRDRPRILSTCLYPLYDSDPEPYFAEDPAHRPPEPLWTDLAAELGKLEDEVGRTPSRLAPLGGKWKQADQEQQETAKKILPLRRDPRELHVPMVASATPYDWTPLALLGDGSSVPADLTAQLKPLVDQDDRGRVALALTGSAPAAAVLAGARAALAAGVDEIELAVGYEQQLKAPPGDYWRERAPDGKVARLGVIPVALDLIAPPAAGPTEGGATEGVEHQGPRARGWDPARAALALHLVVSAKSWQLVAPGGSFPAIAAGDPRKAADELRGQLAQVRAAYPDEDGLALVPGDGATVESLVPAAYASLRDAQGAELFERLALATAAPTSAGKDDLAARVQRRAAAKVSITPDALADRAPSLRRCYLDALDRDAKIAGTLVLEWQEKAQGVKITAGPKDLALRKCISERLGPAMNAGHIRDVKVELSAK